MTPARDTVATLREHLAAGRFQDVLDLAARAEVTTADGPSVHLMMATAATRLGQLTLARTTCEEARRGFLARADDDGLMRADNLLGIIAFELGALLEADTAFLRALSGARHLADPLLTAHATNNLASVSYLLGRVEPARALYREALLAYQRLGDRRGAAQTYYNLAMVARDEGDVPSADGASDHAVRHALDVGSPDLIALALTGRAETAIAGGATDLAEHGLARAVAYAEEAGDEIGLAEIERVRGLCSWKAGDPARALGFAERARETAARLGVKLLEGEAAALAGHVLSALGRPSDAEARWSLARERFQALGATLHLQRLPKAAL